MPQAAANFNLEDCVVSFTDKSYENPAVSRLRLVVELKTDQQARLKEAGERQERRAAGTDEDDEDDDMFDDEDDEVQGIATIEAFRIFRRKCRGSFLATMDDESDELQKFGVKLFDKNGILKPEFIENDYHKGSGCFGDELNQGTIVYVEKVEVKPQYRHKGLGGWALKQLFNSKYVMKGDFVIAWPSPDDPRFLNTAERAELQEKVEAFFYKNGFRRIGRTVFLGYSKDPDHPSRKLVAKDDVKTTYYERYSDIEDPQDNIRSLDEFMMMQEDRGSDLGGPFPLHREIAANTPIALRGGGATLPPGRMPIAEFIALVHANDPDIVHSQNPDGLTPLHVAAVAVNQLAIETLLKPEIAGTQSDLNRRDNTNGTTPLEALEFTLRSGVEFGEAMLGQVQKPYPDLPLQCAYTLRKAMGEDVGTITEYIKQKRWGCTKQGVIMSTSSINGSIGLDFVPPHLWPKIDRTFAEGFRAVLADIIVACRTEDVVPILDRIRALAATDPEAAPYLRKSGRVEYALDFVLTWAREQSVLIDGMFDENMQEDTGDRISQKWHALPICANDLNFELVRAQIGLGRNQIGPYSA
ncbi:hypothetical protein EIP91_010750 [Steccherinum ochraceum]|uniref:Uncharacterized protein n=1 Tax=Steccherinum ochraceum TaxID=92696 RepID=A0A4R0RZ05_9APHY|nr:hypothetical protein EIP91_010750 [Steccherinum ochraceum]